MINSLAPGPEVAGAAATRHAVFDMRQRVDADGALRVTLVGELDIAVADRLRSRLDELGHARRRVRLELSAADVHRLWRLADRERAGAGASPPLAARGGPGRQPERRPGHRAGGDRHRAVAGRGRRVGARPGASRRRLNRHRRRLNRQLQGRGPLADNLAVPMELVTASHAEDPVLDMALTQAMLEGVADRSVPAAVRVFRPGPTVAFGRLDRLRPGFAAACRAAEAHGRAPVLRLGGGRAAAYDAECVVVEVVRAEEKLIGGLEDRFTDLVDLLRDGLATAGVTVEVGELAGEYFPARRFQPAPARRPEGRRGRPAGHLRGVADHGGAGRRRGRSLRATVADVYAALELDVDAATAGAVADRHPEVEGPRPRPLARPGPRRRYAATPAAPGPGPAAPRRRAGRKRRRPGPGPGPGPGRGRRLTRRVGGRARGWCCTKNGGQRGGGTVGPAGRPRQTTPPAKRGRLVCDVRNPYLSDQTSRRGVTSGLHGSFCCL